MKITRRADSGILRSYTGSFGDIVVDTSNNTLVLFTGDVSGGHQLASESSLNVFKRAQIVTPVDLDASPENSWISVDASASNNFRVWAFTSLHIALPNGLNDGQVINYIIINQHDGVSAPHTISFDYMFDFGAAGTPSQLPNGNSKSLLSCIWDDSSFTMLCSWRPGSEYIPVAV